MLLEGDIWKVMVLFLEQKQLLPFFALFGGDFQKRGEEHLQHRLLFDSCQQLLIQAVQQRSRDAGLAGELQQTGAELQPCA